MVSVLDLGGEIQPEPHCYQNLTSVSASAVSPGRYVRTSCSPGLHRDKERPPNPPPNPHPAQLRGEATLSHRTRPSDATALDNQLKTGLFGCINISLKLITA